MANTDYFQPIIRGVQNVGSVQILYRYNKKVTGDAGSFTYQLPLASEIKLPGTSDANYIDCSSDGIPVAGFRLDSEFLRANPQIASSFVIPILGGGGVALTNNNRTGTLNLVCTRVSAPKHTGTETADAVGSLVSDNGEGIGVKAAAGATQAENYWDMVTLAQIQQAQVGGDSYGAQIKLIFSFCGVTTTVTFDACTVATVDPIGLAGNDAVNYNIVFNYLNWSLEYASDNNAYAGLE